MNRILKFFKKAGVLVLGVTIIIIGIILLPLPGPGMLIIAGGLLVLSTEFMWAERHLESMKTAFKEIFDRKETKK